MSCEYCNMYSSGYIGAIVTTGTRTKIRRTHWDEGLYYTWDGLYLLKGDGPEIVQIRVDNGTLNNDWTQYYEPDSLPIDRTNDQSYGNSTPIRTRNPQKISFVDATTKSRLS